MDSLGRGGPPTEIPDPGSLALSYDEIADGEVVGQGGNADVFRVAVRRNRREIPVAVKQPRLQGTLDTDTVDRFVREADVWAELDDHDHIVSLYDWGTEPLPWLAMEYMDRGTLADVPDGVRLPLEQALWVGVCVCRAVHHAHRFGVAHHDIKPANVLFTSSGDGWAVPKVSDWGLARLMLDETGSVEGLSPHYAAPEQFDAERYGSPDDRTDIYQVGTLVYELVTGRPPFEGSATAVMQSVLSEEPTPPSEVADVPAELDDILAKALAKEPDDRYDSILYLRDRLQQLFDSHHEGQSEATGVPSGVSGGEESTADTVDDGGPDIGGSESAVDDGPGVGDRETDDPEPPPNEGTTAGDERSRPERPAESSGQADSDGALSRRVVVGATAGLAIAVLLALVITTGAIDIGGSGSEPGGLTSGSGVDIDEVNVTGQVAAGDEFTVAVTVSNTANSIINDTVDISVGSIGNTTREVTVPTGDTETLTVGFETDEDDAGEYSVAVSSGDDSAEASIEVVLEEPELAVNIENATSPVFAGESLGVTATVTNEGDDEWSGAVALLNTTGGAVDETDVSVPAGENVTVELEWSTDDNADVSGEISVNARDDALGVVASGSESVTVNPTDRGAFNITEIEAPSEIAAGETFEVTVTVENTGGESDAQGLTVDTGFDENSTLLNLDPDDSKTETFTFQTDDPGEYTISVSTDDAEQSTALTVLESASVSNLDIAGAGADATVPEGETVTVSFDVTNDGDTPNRFDVTVAVGGREDSTETRTLEPGETAEEAFAFPGLDLGTYDVTASAGGQTLTGTLEIISPTGPSLAGLDIGGDGTDATVTLPSDEPIDVTVENVGGVSGAFDVTLAVGDAVEQTESVEVGGEATGTVTFDSVTGDLEPGTYDVTVSVGDDTTSGTLSVERPAGAFFEITGADGPGGVNPGDTATLSATIQNVGADEGTQQIRLDRGGTTEADTTLTVGSNKTGTVEFELTFDNPGNRQYTFETNDDTASVSVNIAEQPASFIVTDVQTNSPVDAGDEIVVDATIENGGGREDTQTITLNVESLGSDSTDVTLDGGEQTTVALSVSTGSGDAGSYAATVGSEEDAETESVVVQSTGGGAGVNVTSISTNTPVAGETLEVDATVENTGASTQTQAVSLDAGPLGTDSQTVTLASGSSTSVTLSVGTSSGDAGTYTVTVSTEDETASTSVTVSAPADFDVSITSANSPVTAGDKVVVEYTVENTGDEQDMQDIDFVVGTTSQETRTGVTLDGGESTSGQFTYQTSESDTPSITVRVVSDDDDASRGVTVNEQTATFQVNDVSLNPSIVTEGDSFDVDVTVKNTGNAPGDKSVSLDTGGLSASPGDKSVQLDGGQTKTVTFSDVPTQDGEGGQDYTITATTPDDSSGGSATLTVEERTANFQVQSVSLDPDDVEEGESFDVSVTVKNTGEVETTKDVSLDTGDLSASPSDKSVQLDGGQTETVTFSDVPTGEDEGRTEDYTITATTPDDSSGGSAMLTVGRTAYATVPQADELWID